jgi:hypothetical protein
VARASDSFLWCHHLDLLYLVGKLPLIGVMWRGYAATYTGQ